MNAAPYSPLADREPDRLTLAARRNRPQRTDALAPVSGERRDRQYGPLTVRGEGESFDPGQADVRLKGGERSGRGHRPTLAGRCIVTGVGINDSPSSQPVRYERIGRGYARTRREDPRFAERISAALGTAQTIVNVGAGAGSYEPPGRHVIAVEPSDVMAAQRPRGFAPALRASAEQLPLRDQSVDAAMAVLSVHHWDDAQEQGVRELRRVARGPVVILTYDARISNRMWLMADYLPEVAELDARIFPSPEQLRDWLGGGTAVQTVEIPRDTPDWMLGSFWAHPERVLDADARNATSGFARMSDVVIDRVTRTLKTDLDSGLWNTRHGHLRRLDSYDVGLRLLVNTP